MFWIQALIEVKVVNVISTLFFIYRGLSLTQIFYLAIVFSVVSLLTEIPSSYLADKWGRKKVIVLAVLANVIYWVVNIFAWSFPVFVLTVSLYALAHALMSGTDEALIYDTSKQLKLEGKSLERLGNYFSARRIFKIVTPILAVLIARDLSNIQYILIISIDIVATLVALTLSLFLIEPKHSLKVEKIEADIIRDAIKLFRENTNLLRMMFNKSLFFISLFILWRVSSEFFTSKGVSLLLLGLMVAGYQLTIFVINRNVVKLFSWLTIEKRINVLNLLIVILLIGFFGLNLLGISGWWLLIIFALALTAEMVRWPLFSEIINQASSSYNRATTISLANFLKSVLDIPLLLLSAYLVSLSYSHLIGLVVILSASAWLFFPLRENSKRDKAVSFQS